MKIKFCEKKGKGKGNPYFSSPFPFSMSKVYFSVFILFDNTFSKPS